MMTDGCDNTVVLRFWPRLERGFVERRLTCPDSSRNGRGSRSLVDVLPGLPRYGALDGPIGDAELAGND